MTETRSTSRNQNAALVGLVTVIVLVLASPLGWAYLIPQIGQTIATVWASLGVMGAWIVNDVVMPVLAWIAGLFA